MLVPPDTEYTLFAIYGSGISDLPASVATIAEDHVDVPAFKQANRETQPNRTILYPDDDTETGLVLMDEPDSSTDVDALQKIFEAIQFLKENGTTVLLITHSTRVQERADHAFLLCCGKLMGKGPVDKIVKYFGEKCIPLRPSERT